MKCLSIVEKDRCIDVIFAVEMAQMGFKWQSVIIASSWLPDRVIDNGPKITMTTNENGPADENSWVFQLSFIWGPSRGHEQQPFTDMYTSFSI